MLMFRSTNDPQRGASLQLVKSKRQSIHGNDGFSVIEIVVALVILALISTSILGLYTVLVQTTFVAKRRSVASGLATNQMEYLKSLSYNSLAVAGGSIVATSPLPATFTKTINGVTYTVTTSINYIDDAFDGCRILSQCINTPVPAGAPSNDLNPADYKTIHITVTTAGGLKLAEVDTKVSARVAETASNTGAILVKVLDPSGGAISGATVSITNSTTSPTVAVSDSTDSGGVAIFYNLPPDTTGYDYIVNATYGGYSSLTTIGPNGALQPSYPSQQLLTQQSSLVTLTLKPQGQFSLAAEVVDTSGVAIANAKVYVKGGYKKYTSLTDTSYYYDLPASPSDVRPIADTSGLFTLTNLVPGPYYFCGDAGATGCTVGGSTYYLAAAVPYGGITTLNPIVVPTYLASSPPPITFTQSGNNYLQKVRLILTNNISFPRVSTLTPAQESTSGALSAFSFVITGTNLPCSATAASCSTSVKFTQASNTYTASCTGTTGLTINCTVNLTGIAAGNTQLVVASGGNTLTLPAAPLIGGLVITP